MRGVLRSLPSQSLRPRSVARNAAVLIANTFIGSGLGFLFWVVVARTYPPAAVGTGAALITLASLAAAAGEVGMGNTLVKVGRESARAGFNTMLTLVIATTFGVGLSVGITATILSPPLAAAVPAHLVWLAVAGSGVFIAVGQMQDRLFVGREAPILLLGRNSIAGITRLCLAVLAFRDLGAAGLLLSVGAASAISAALVGRVFWRGVVPRYRPSWRPSALTHSWRFASADHIATLTMSAPIYVLPSVTVALLGPERGGYFYISWMIANIVFVIPTAVATMAFASAANDSRPTTARYWARMRMMLVGLFPTAIAGYFGAPMILSAFGPAYAREASGLLAFLILSVVPFGVIASYLSHFRIVGDTAGLVRASLASSGASLGLVFAFAGAGLEAMGAAWLFGQVAVALALVAHRYARSRADAGPHTDR